LSFRSFCFPCFLCCWPLVAMRGVGRRDSLLLVCVVCPELFIHLNFLCLDQQRSQWLFCSPIRCKLSDHPFSLPSTDSPPAARGPPLHRSVFFFCHPPSPPQRHSLPQSPHYNLLFRGPFGKPLFSAPGPCFRTFPSELSLSGSPSPPASCRVLANFNDPSWCSSFSQIFVPFHLSFPR